MLVLHVPILHRGRPSLEGYNVIFSHQLQLRYDSQLAAFISMVEETLQAKRDEIWRHVHNLADAAGLSQDACLTLAL